VEEGVGLFYVDRHIVVGGVAVAGGAYALGHALAAVECRTTNDIASTRRRGAAVALFLDGRDIKFRFDRGGLDLHRRRSADQITAGVAPGTAHDNAEADDPPRHDVTTPKL
jgi:hypothetical protein